MRDGQRKRRSDKRDVRKQKDSRKNKCFNLLTDVLVGCEEPLGQYDLKPHSYANCQIKPDLLV